MVLNFVLRIMCIKDGLLLDSDILEVIKKVVKDNDY